MMKIKITLLLLIALPVCVLAQSPEALAKYHFIEAQSAYGNGDNNTALTNLQSCVEALTKTNSKIEALYTYIYFNKKDFIKAKSHLTSYFDIASEDHSDYMKMISLLKEVTNKAKESEQKEIERVQKELEQKQKWLAANKIFFGIRDGFVYEGMIITGDFRIEKNEIIIEILSTTIDTKYGSGQLISSIKAEIINVDRNTGNWGITQKGEEFTVNKILDIKGVNKFMVGKEFNFGNMENIDLINNYLIFTIVFEGGGTVHVFSKPVISINSYLKKFNLN